MAGLAGLSLPQLLQRQALAAKGGQPTSKGKSVILLWMAGGPSHIDTWDPKPDRPFENRGPFGVIQTKLPGVQICEHLPKQAAMLDKFTIIRSVDPRKSNHEPNKVFQTGNRDAAPRVSPKGDQYPAIGSIVAKQSRCQSAWDSTVRPHFSGQKSHVAYAGYLGRQYDPFIAEGAAKLPIYDLVGKDTGRISNAPMFQFAPGLSLDRISNRRSLLNQLDRLQRRLDHDPAISELDEFSQQAVDLMSGRQVQQAFDLSQGAGGIARAIRRSFVVSKGAACPPASRSGRGLRDD